MPVAAKRALSVAAVALAYYALALVGLQSAFSGTAACPVWPASGFALAAAITLGTEAAAGVFLGSWIANYQVAPAGGAAAWTCAAIALASAAQASLGARVLGHRLSGPDAAVRCPDVIMFAVAAPLVCLVSATAGIGVLLGGGFMPEALAGRAWLTWWIGDTAGVMIVAPLLFAWQRALQAERRSAQEDLWEAHATLRVAALGRREDGLRIQLYRRIVDELPVGIAVLRLEKAADPDSWLIVEMNAIGRLQSGAKGENPAGKRLLDYAPEVRDSALIRACTEALNLNRGVEVSDFTSTTRVPGGRFAIKVFPLGAPLVGIAFEDVSLRRSAEDALMRSQKALEELSAELTRSNSELTQFAYVASHDLQAPLRKATAFAEHLRLRLGASLDDTSRNFLERLDRSLLGMQALIDALLILARVSTRAEPHRAVELDAVAAEVRADFEEQAASAKGLVQFSPLPVVTGDPSQLRQLLQNLVGNALKFRDAGRPPLVRVTGRTLDDGRCEVKVEDNGIGFDMKHARRVFEPFQRLHSAQEYQGTGMGLAICHKIAERHGGRITVYSVPGRGSAFTVLLPAGVPQDRPCTESSASKTTPISSI